MCGNQNAMMQKHKEENLHQNQVKEEKKQKVGQGNEPPLAPNYVEQHHQRQLSKLTEMELGLVSSEVGMQKLKDTTAVEYQSRENKNLSKHQRNKLKKRVAERDVHDSVELKARMVFRDDHFDSGDVNYTTFSHDKYLSALQVEVLYNIKIGLGADMEHSDVTGYERHKRADKYKNKNENEIPKIGDTPAALADALTLTKNIQLDQLANEKPLHMSRDTKVLASALDSAEYIEPARVEALEACSKVKKQLKDAQDKGEPTDELERQVKKLEERSKKLEDLQEYMTKMVGETIPELESVRRQYSAIETAISIMNDEMATQKSKYNEHVMNHLKRAEQETSGLLNDLTEKIRYNKMDGDNPWNTIIKLARLREMKDFRETENWRKEIDRLRTSESDASKSMADVYAREKFVQKGYERSGVSELERADDMLHAKTEYENAVKDLFNNL